MDRQNTKEVSALAKNNNLDYFVYISNNYKLYMKKLFNKLFSLNALAFLFILFIGLVIVLIATPVETTFAGGIFLFVVLCGIAYLAVKEYNKRNGLK